ncbi:MAG: exonuclease SbcCD subunit D [Bacteriovoracaceae bacterium]
MRILHTSDWHLGKRLFKLDRSLEHIHFLDWLIETLKENQIDILLITGDIFDSPTPPHQSLEIFYNFLYRLSSETKVMTFLIAGNHDSGHLLEAPAQLLSSHRVKVWGKLSPNPEDHWFNLDGKIEICAIPFFRSYELLPSGEGDALLALKKYLHKEKVIPQILLLHHLAGIYEAAGSEQVISLSGVDSIPVEQFKNFNYVALGHIHKPQKVGPLAFYSGSPIPLRFSETQAKSVVIIEGDKIEILPIPLSRALIQVKTNIHQWKDQIQKLSIHSKLTPVVEIQIQLNAPEMGLIDQIKKEVELKGYELLSYIPSFSSEINKEKRKDHLFEMGPLELFREFYAIKFPDAPELPEELREDFSHLVAKVKNAPHST